MPGPAVRVDLAVPGHGDRHVEWIARIHGNPADGTARADRRDEVVLRRGQPVQMDYSIK